MFKVILIAALLIPLVPDAQYRSRLTMQQWTDSVFRSLSDEEKIAQLMVIRAHSNLGADHIAKVTDDIMKYNVGGLCFFQGGPVRQANLTNFYQSIAKTPLMVTIDAEWGLGMRLDSVIKYPYQLTLGALDDERLVYRMGLAVGEQCKRLGVHVNYAPVVDINNNPNNPVIGYRSFGEDRDKVSSLGVAYMKGMQDAGIMACAKHFPGHGDVDVDSHLDLPVINKTRPQLDSMELTPFRALFRAGVGSVMIAHLYIPTIDNTANRATSISKNNVTNLLKNDMGYQGLTFTDALEMKGVTKYFPGGTIAVEALIAGNDMLCLPESVPQTIEAVKQAIAEKRLSWDELNPRVRKVLEAKYKLGLNRSTTIAVDNLLNDLNSKTDLIKKEVAEKTITVLKDGLTPLSSSQRIAYIGIGNGRLNAFGQRLQDDLKAETFLFAYNDNETSAATIMRKIQEGRFEKIVISISDYALRPANNYNITPAAVKFLKDLQALKPDVYTYVFGNVLALQNFCEAKFLIACYQDESVTHHAAADLAEGKIFSMGKLPVSVCQYKFGDGIVHGGIKPSRASVSEEKLGEIDSIINDAISKKAFPGAVVLAAHKGNIIYHKAFGHYEYDNSPAMTPESIFDLASVTKISATTVSVMKLYEQGKLRLNAKLEEYLPWVRGTDKAGLVIQDILLHQAGLVPFIPFYRETIDSASGMPHTEIYSDKQKEGYRLRVAENLYIRDDWQDTMFTRILNSPLGRRDRYVYSDNDFIFLGKIVEQLSGLTLDQFVEKTFYRPMGMQSTGYLPR
jgi:beta-N-acetylhexosaminidase